MHFKKQHISILTNHISRTHAAGSGQRRTRHFDGRQRISLQSGLLRFQQVQFEGLFGVPDDEAVSVDFKIIGCPSVILKLSGDPVWGLQVRWDESGVVIVHRSSVG